MGTAKLYIAWAVIITCCAAGMLFGETTVGEPFDVAPDLEDTVFQKWPHAAWSAQANCWLVVWREGDLNLQGTDIWCARVSADGTSMDPAGIRITEGNGVQDRPAVASDGKDFFVVWQDLRNEKDWDVYAARVSADGKVLEPDGFLVSGGPHNQCLPTLVHTGANYYLAWQSWVEDAVIPALGSYEIRGARISSGGKVLDVDGIVLVKPTGCKPRLAVHPEGGLVVVFIGHAENGRLSGGIFFNYPAFQRIDPEKGGPVGSPTYFGRKSKDKVGWDRGESPAAAIMKDGTTLVGTPGDKGGLTLFRYDKDGKRIGDAQRFRKDNKNTCMTTVMGMASDGEKTLMTFDFPTGKGSLAAHRGRLCMKVWGWMLSPDGKVLEGGTVGIPIANKDDTDSVQGYPCVGPAGTFLVVHGEMRDVGFTTRVVGRLIK